MTKVNPNNGNETKSDIFPWNIFKYVTSFFTGSKILKIFQLPLSLVYLNFIPKVSKRK